MVDYAIGHNVLVPRTLLDYLRVLFGVPVEAMQDLVIVTPENQIDFGNPVCGIICYSDILRKPRVRDRDHKVTTFIKTQVSRKLLSDHGGILDVQRG